MTYLAVAILAAFGGPLVAYMAFLSPPRTDDDNAFRRELAFAIESASSDPWEQRQLVRIAHFESSFRRDVGTCLVRGPQGELGSWQVLPRTGAERIELCASLEQSAAIALARIRESVSACRRSAPEDRLALYTRGNCASVEGRRLSRVRWERSR